MKKEHCLARRQGGLSHRPARCPRGMVGECRPQTVWRQPIRRWTASSRSRSRSHLKNSFAGRRSTLLLVEAVKCVAAPSPVCPGSRAPSSVPRPVPRRTARGPLADAHAGALACAHHHTRRCRPSPGPLPPSRPTPPAPVPVGGWAAGGRVTSGCARESVGLRRCALLGGAAGGGAVEACASSMRRARADR